ncbi:MAG: NAD(P)H-hydrate dehydratase [bacterium]
MEQTTLFKADEIMEIVSIEKKQCKSIIPNRPADGHKYNFGRVLIWAGSHIFRGAPLLVCKGAYRTGAGLVRLACPEDLIAPIASALPETTFLPLQTTPPGSFLPNTIITLIQCILENQFNALVIGPGLGQNNLSSRFLRELLQKITIPLLLDGDALNVLATVENLSELMDKLPEKVLTPHEGEFSRLINTPTDLIRKNRAEFALDFAKKYRCVLVLKGQNTIITNGKSIFSNTTGGVNLATAGTGDVLAGIIGALLAQGISALDASILGVYLHGTAGDLWKKQHGDRGMLASEVADLIPTAYQTLSQK